MDASFPRWDAIIIAGPGAQSRTGSDGPASPVHGRSPLRICLDAVRRAEKVSVVGYGTSRGSFLVAAEIAAGLHTLRHSGSDFTAILADDLPRVAASVAFFVDAVGSGVVDDGLIDFDRGRSCPRVAICRTRSLRTAAAQLSFIASPSARALFDSLALRRVRVPRGT